MQLISNGLTTYPTVNAVASFHASCFDCISLKTFTIDLDSVSPRRNIERYMVLIWIAKQMIRAYCWITIEYPTREKREEYIDMLMSYHWKIKQIDPNYQIPQRPTLRQITNERM